MRRRDQGDEMSKFELTKVDSARMPCARIGSYNGCPHALAIHADEVPFALHARELWSQGFSWLVSCAGLTGGDGS